MRFGKLHSYINGTYTEADGASLPVIYPATNETIAEFYVAGSDLLDRAVTDAIEAQRHWAALLPAQRARILSRAADLIRSRNDELAVLEVWDTGKPIQEALTVDIVSGADAVEYFAHAAALIQGQYYPLGSSFAYAIPEPLGVVAGIGAWNYPFQIACWKSAPALAAGNAMIFKPSEMTVMTALKLAEIYTEAGLPDGLFQVLLGDASLGKSIVAHPEIHKVSLTGEVGTGKKIMASAAETLKHVTLELGGKSPLLIFEDADLDNAVQAAMMANFFTQGEICSNATRVFVHSSVEQDFLERLKRATDKLIIGDPMDPKTQIGALISKEHCEKVNSYLKAGLAEQARRYLGNDSPEIFSNPDEDPLQSVSAFMNKSSDAMAQRSDLQVLLEGSRRTGQALKAGNFVAPTVFVNCTDQMKIVREEIFGPVMSVLRFEDEEEAIRRANATPYGLAAGVFTKDINRGHRIARALQAGIVWINNYNLTPIEIPFGGYKQSGLGRENSLEALKAYLQLKTVYIEAGDVDSPYR